MDQGANSQPVQVPSDAKQYLEELMEDAGMTTLTDEMHDEVVQQLYKRLDSFLASVVIENMPPEHLDAFIKMNEENKPKDEIEAFVKEHIPNAQEVFTNAFIEFRSKFVGGVEKAQTDQAQ